MAAEGQDRLISASEVERWSYCPLSWKLERNQAPEREEILSRGLQAHEDVADKATRVIKAEKGAQEAEITTWIYISLSIIFLFLGVSQAFLTSVGFISLTYWRIMIIGVSIVLVGLSVAFYFRKSRKTGRLKGIREIIKRPVDGRSTQGLYPFLFFLFGIVLLLNGFIMLRPFGIGVDISAGILSFSLIALYVFLLVNMLLHFMHNGSREGPEGRKLVIALVFGLFLALSVLVMLVNLNFDLGTPLGYTMIILSLIWFLASVIYDLANRVRWKKKEDPSGSRSTDLSIIMMAILATFFAASTFIARDDSLKGYYILAVIVSALWTVGALFFFFVGVISLRSASKGKEKLSIPVDGRIIEAFDIDKGGSDSEPLVSQRHYLIGSPDMIIEENGFKIPVEIKSGRIPPKPHFSHVMQLGAYLILLDENFGQVTPYGYIDYRPSSGESKRFTGEWDMMAKALVLSKVSEIRESEKTGIAHRNHRREGKCRNCSRRSGCPEKIV
ncbi:MAG: PD-(D/E)XK nuclease family protein [Thermoplasmatota archaeon]